MLGEEARTKTVRVLLAPTVNIHRSSLAGCNFECYSEDPLLFGRIAAAYVRGVQSRGVVTTVKHFAGNDAEFERNTINSVIDERTLREITLVPFELAVREGGALGIMTAYNRLNGPYCAEHEWLLHDVLRADWGFEGFVLTDWFGQGSTVGSARAGLDLEMPGPGRIYGPALADVVRRDEVDGQLLDDAVEALQVLLPLAVGLRDDLRMLLLGEQLVRQPEATDPRRDRGRDVHAQDVGVARQRQRGGVGDDHRVAASRDLGDRVLDEATHLLGRRRRRRRS